MDFQGHVLCFSTFLVFIGTVLCNNENFSCHVCRSDQHPECKDEFGGRDNRFLEPCDTASVNKTISCRKEVNQVYAGKDMLIIRKCFYTEGYKPEEEVEAYRTTYWYCFSHGCNGQGLNKPALSIIALAGSVATFLNKNLIEV